MLDRIDNRWKKWLVVLAFLANSACLAYSLAARFSNLLFVPMAEKIGILVGYLIITTLFSTLVFLYWFKFILTAYQGKSWLLVVLVCFILVGLIFTLAYNPPPFPQSHTLTISALGESRSQSSNTRVEIAAVSTVNYPNKEQHRIPVREFEYSGVWRGITGSDFMITISDGNPASLTFRRFMQAGINIEFQRGPDCGIVSVKWDGDETIIDLYNEEPDTQLLTLEPDFTWKKADRTRKVLIAGACLSDLTAAVSLLSIVALAMIHLIKTPSGFQLRKPWLLGACAIIIVISLVILQQIDIPITFNNPAIEAGVRSVLNQPVGDLYRKQLRAVVSLDLSGMEMSDLDGIEQLPNLAELNLRNNHIQDISPISALTKLQKLNLRGNRVSDLSPISGLDQLEYLNVFGNTAIQSLAPVSSLPWLETLILAQVPVDAAQIDWKNLSHLTYLNLRACNLSDIAFIADLPDLESLNLHSNPDIVSIQPLKNLGDLQTLILANIPLGEEAQDISEFKRLRYLNLRNTELAEIGFLSGLYNLEYLNLHSNPDIASISPIKNLTNLEQLVLRDVPIDEQSSALAGLTNLHTLNIRNTGITDTSFLAEIMGRGGLQDNEKQGITAAIDLRDNPISVENRDNYADIRSYWQNISFAEPGVLPFYAELDPPRFSHASGFYNEPFSLEINAPAPDTTIYYTNNGSEPTSNSKVYTGPIDIKDRSNQPNSLANIETIAADWHMPETNIQKAFIVRAIAINEKTGASSPIMTHTYFVGPEIQDQALPVISLVTQRSNLFDAESGIYVLGETYMDMADQDISEDEKQKYANFNQRGEEWERPVHIEIFDQEKQPVFAQNGGIRIHGGGSRRTPQKSLRIFADCIYDTQCEFQYPVFTVQNDGRNSNDKLTYGTILLRDFGQDWMVGMMRDSVSQDLLRQTGLDTQAEQIVKVFLNGEYWGIYQLQERYDEYYLQNHYGLGENEASILRQNGGLFRGNEADAKNYRSLMDFIESHDLSDQDSYDYVRSQIDIENYIDYLVANIYLGNTDWPDNNIYMWRKSLETNDPSAEYGQDGRWRWMIFDMDFTLGLNGYGKGYEHNTLQHAQMEGWSGEFFRSLLENQEFADQFINTFADHMNATFTPERIITFIDQHQENLASEMDEFFDRWGSNNESLSEEWYAEVEVMREYARKRPAYMQQYIIEQFGLSGTSTVSISLENKKGAVKINSLDIKDTSSWKGVYFNGIPVTITAIPQPGYQFSHWEGIDSIEPEIKVSLSSDLQLSPVFIED